MAEKTDTRKVHQHLLSDDERRKWKVIDTAVVSPTRVTTLLQNDQELCIDTFDYDGNEFQRGKRICLHTDWKEPPLLLSYLHVEKKLKHFICTKTKLHLINDESESIEKSVPLSAELSALCVKDNTVYISTNETKNLMRFKPELPTDTSTIYLKGISNRGSIVEFVVHSKNIYVCTNDGQVSSHKETGGKQHDYRNRKSIGSKACGLAVFTPQGKECNLLLVTWNDNKLIIYSTQTSYDLLDIDLNVPGKIRVTTSCFLMSSGKNDVVIYNMKTVADRGAFKMILVSGSKDKDLSYLYDDVLHDTATVRALSRNVSMNRKTLRTLVQMYDYSCETNDTLIAKKKKARAESDELRRMNEEKEEKCCSLTKQLEAERKTTEELKHEIDRSKKEKDDVTEELENTRSNLSRKEADLSNVKAKLDEARTESDELRRMNEEKEEKCCSITKQLEAERKTTEELKHEIDRSKKEKKDVTEELENTRSNLSRKEADLSDVRAKLDEARTESDELRRMNEEKEEKCCSLTKQLEAERKTTEELKHEIDRSKKEKKDVTEELENTRSNLSRKEADLSNVEAKLDEARTESDELRRMNEEKEEKCDCLTKQLEAEKKTTEELNERLKYLKDMNTELESQQKKLKDHSAQEKEKVATNLKKVEKRNTKLEDEVTQLKERLLVEEKSTKEVQTSSLMLKERIKDLEDMRTELESQQKKLKYTLAQEKDKVTRAEGSRVQAENARKTLEHTKASLEKEKAYLTKLLAANERNETEMKKSLAKATTTCEKLQKANEILQKEKEDLSEQLSTEKNNSEIQIASFSKMTSHALSGSEMTAQRKYEDSYLCDETQSTITESTDSGRGSMHSRLEYQDSFILNGRQLNTEFKVAVTVASKGANMHIPDTGVELDIPTGATQGKVLIEMIILPFDKLDAPVSTFSCNSSVAVELLPNKMEFQRPVRLILPHCLKLTKNYQKTKQQVQVYVSHHNTGPPIWEEVPNAKYVLDETNCIILLKSFCWVKYEVNNKIVEAKRIRVYTAGRRLKHTEDSLAEIEVGYHWDLPIARENLSVNDNMFVYQSKPFIYLKEGNLPLEIFLTKTVPMQWKYITPKENPKVISFKCVADSKEKSCPFVIEKSEPTDRMPFCMFKVQQGNEDLELYIRFDD